ncbi:MAG: hypothetical protein JWN43_626 [Gammaproteobacteria bacterium]|nr:hypothetical protein [Gammaproteobacteria bacterium]
MSRLAVTPSSWGLPRERWAWVALALGCGLLWFSSQSLYYGIVSSRWPKAEATIAYSTAYQSRRFPRVDIRYNYRVDGNEYTGDGFRYSFYMNRARMRAIEIAAAQAEYPVGAQTRVAVDPHNPSRSVLEPGPHFGDLLWVGAGLMFAVTGLLSGRTERAPPSTSEPAAAGTVRSGKHRYQIAKTLACISFLLMSAGLYRIYSGIAASSWPTVNGRVLYSRTGGADSAGNHLTEVRYEYFLAGRRYGGAASLLGRHDHSFELSKSHPVGQPVEVHYDPTDPEHSVIETGVTWHHFMLPLYAVVVFLLAALAKGVADALG